MPRHRRNTDDQVSDQFAQSINLSDAQLVARTSAQENGEEEPDEPLEMWQPHRMQDIDFSAEEEEPTDDPDWCFLCHVSQSRYDVSENKYLQGMLRYFDENYHLVAPKTLTSQAQLFYNTNLRPYLQEPKVWRKETIFKHFDQHAPTSRIMHEDTLRTYNNVMRVLRDDGLFLKEQNTGRLNVDKKALDMFIRVERQRTMILNRVKEQRPHAVL